MCGEVTKKLLGEKIIICGWVHKRRNLGSLIFISLRDRTGLIQAVVNQEEKDLFKIAQDLRPEFVVEIEGRVASRNQKDINLELITGEIEIITQNIKIFSQAETPPFQVLDINVKEDLRLKYRYLDLRRPELQKNFFIRHKTAQIIREFLNQNNFLEIETPMLTKSTPEGARDYLVPSRVHTGEFYALPQSPQLFKQILMASGFDRYYQIAKCFRDEDLRADRQPEFTQVDLELCFCEIQDIINLNENLLKKIFKEILNINLETPFEKLTYQEALERFGSDKPDLRFDLEIKNLNFILKNCEANMFREIINSGGSIRGFKIINNNLSRRNLDLLNQVAKENNAEFFYSVIIEQDKNIKSYLEKFLNKIELEKIILEFNAQPGDMILICAGKINKHVLNALGVLRNLVANKLNLIKQDIYKFVWLLEFPMFEFSQEENKYFAMHHPFTMPLDEDIKFLDSQPDKVRAKSYDIILNGVELGGGSFCHLRVLGFGVFD